MCLSARISPEAELAYMSGLQHFCARYLGLWSWLESSSGTGLSNAGFFSGFQVKLIPVLGSQPADDVSHKPGGRLPLLSARPAVTPATPKRAAASFAAW